MLTSTRKRTFILYIFVGYILKITLCQPNLINFGGSTEESKQAEYYMMVDSGFPNTAPTEDLKRTQRSFWKKLFKHGLFGEGECNDRCSSYDGNNYNNPPNAESCPPFQPFRPLHPWRPFQPWFRGNCQRCGLTENNCNYANNQGPTPYNNNYDDTPSPQPTYGDSPIIGNTYIPNEENEGYSKQDQPPYEAPSIPPNESGTDATDQPYAPSSGVPENINAQPYDNKDGNDLSNMKMPQILYQPIIYVSPQYHENALNQLKPKTEYSEKETSTTDAKVENQVTQTEYASDPTTQTHYDDINNSPNSVVGTNDESKYEKSPVVGYSNQQHSVPLHCGQPCSAHIPMPTPCFGSSNPSLSTISTVYTVITPSQVVPAATLGETSRNDCHPSKFVTSKNQHSTEYQQTGPSKYSLFHSNGVPTPDYAKNIPPALTHTPIHLTLDDQPYRVCPELFEDYNRQLNRNIPCAQSSSSPRSSGNTFINAQVISY